MIERAFEEARLDKDNKRNPVKQFALNQAWRLLEAAGVKDPAIRDQVVATRPQTAVESLYFIPEGVGVRWALDIGGKTVDQLEVGVKGVGNVSGYGLDRMHNPKFTTLEEVTPQELIKLPVSALGLPGTPTTEQIFERATHSRIGDMALKLCRAEVGPHQRIKDTEQPLNDYYYIMHEPITDRGGYPSVFELERDALGLWLSGAWAEPDDGWDPDDQVVFTLRKIEPVKS